MYTIIYFNNNMCDIYLHCVNRNQEKMHFVLRSTIVSNALIKIIDIAFRIVFLLHTTTYVKQIKKMCVMLEKKLISETCAVFEHFKP